MALLTQVYGWNHPFFIKGKDNTTIEKRRISNKSALAAYPFLDDDKIDLKLRLVWTLMISFDNKILAATMEQYIRLYDLESGKAICPPFRYPDAADVGRVAFTSDSQYLFAFFKDTLAAFNLKGELISSQKPLPPNVHFADIRHCRRQNRLVYSTAKDDFGVWDWTYPLPDPVTAGAIQPPGHQLIKLVGTPQQYRRGELTRAEVCVTKAGHMAVVANETNIHVMKLGDKIEQMHVLQTEAKSSIFCIVMTPDDQSIIISSDTPIIYMYDFVSQKLIRSFKGHLSAVWRLAIMPNGNTLLSASIRDDMRLIAWRIDSAEPFYQPPIGTHGVWPVGCLW